MHGGDLGYPCPRCRKETNWSILSGEDDDDSDDSKESELEADLAKFAASAGEATMKERMSLDEWTVYAADSVSTVLPQEVEVEVCIWLKTMAWQLGMVNNPKRLYGNIIFDSLGELFDFEVQCLSLEMLSHGFGNWMNTLSSGEILLDIVNGLIEHIPKDAKTSILPYKWTPLPIKRMVHTAPNRRAVSTFLLNHDRLLRDFLSNIMKVLRPVDYPSTKLPLDLRQTVKKLGHIGHSLLRNSHTIREWTWKGLMLLVMTLMALTGSLDDDLQVVFCQLTGEDQANVSELRIPELKAAYQAIYKKKVPEPKSFKTSKDSACGPSLPYKRVLKQGAIDFKSQLAMEYGLE